MRIALSARGSRGDVHPILAVAACLRARGHHVRLCVPETFAARARAIERLLGDGAQAGLCPDPGPIDLVFPQASPETAATPVE